MECKVKRYVCCKSLCNVLNVYVCVKHFTVSCLYNERYGVAKRYISLVRIAVSCFGGYICIE